MVRIGTRLGMVLAAGVLVACAGEDDEVAEDPEVDGAAEDATAAADGTAVALAETELGEVLVDDDGMTLYLFEADEPGTSNCEGECAENWPPLVTGDEPVAGDGVDEALLDTLERDDGEEQITYDGWPLYGFVGDQEPGDVTGQGVEDVWWVLDADGAAIRDGAPDPDEDEDEDPAY